MKLFHFWFLKNLLEYWILEQFQVYLSPGDKEVNESKIKMYTVMFIFFLDSNFLLDTSKHWADYGDLKPGILLTKLFLSSKNVL